jgi:hypothetical protein
MPRPRPYRQEVLLLVWYFGFFVNSDLVPWIALTERAINFEIVKKKEKKDFLLFSKKLGLRLNALFKIEFNFFQNTVRKYLEVPFNPGRLRERYKVLQNKMAIFLTSM